MFYGVSKNKNGKDISDYDRYKPWNSEEFSGKMKYTLSNGKQFEVFREFNKKNPKIYNENLEDISNTFNIDKTKGNQFFIDQTGIDENVFFNTMTICQTETTLDSSKQNSLLQKITNVVSSGDDSISYKKTMEKLNKKLVEEVGTLRTSGRPINIIEDEIKNLEKDKSNLELYKSKMQSIDNENIKDDLEKINKELDILKEIKEYKQNEMINEQRIGVNTQKLNEYNNKLDELKSHKSNLKSISKKCLNPILALIIGIAITGISLSVKNNIITIIVAVLSILIFLINLYSYNKYKTSLDEQKEIKIKQNKEMEIIQDNIRQCLDEINLDRDKIEQNQNEQKERLIDRYGRNNNVDEYILEELEELEKDIQKKQNEYNEIILKENAISIEKKNISNQLDSLVEKEERLQYLYEQQECLKKLSTAIVLAGQGIEEAYRVMKNSVTPKFTNELTDIVTEITNGKYKRINFNDENGLVVELENGEYINCNRLSIGTIDQMYLALRLSILDEISNEEMPIILDEAFAYYDEERLKNIFKYLIIKYPNRQIIIFTCTNREETILNNINEKYNLVIL